MTKMIFVRHGKTLANRLGLLQGQGDSPLTPEGEGEAKAVANSLANQKFDSLYCSDLGRAVSTEVIIRQVIPSLPAPIYSPLLRSIDFGALSGMPREVVMPFVRHHKANLTIPYPGGGESGQELIDRVDRFVRKTAQNHPGETLLVVTHSGVTDLVVRLFGGEVSGAVVIVEHE